MRFVYIILHAEIVWRVFGFSDTNMTMTEMTE
jgi:hypothetical protein